MLYDLEQGIIPRKVESQQIMSSGNLPKADRQFSKARSPSWQFAPYNYVVSLLSAVIIEAVTNSLLSVI